MVCTANASSRGIAAAPCGDRRRRNSRPGWRPRLCHDWRLWTWRCWKGAPTERARVRARFRPAMKTEMGIGARISALGMKREGCVGLRRIVRVLISGQDYPPAFLMQVTNLSKLQRARKSQQMTCWLKHARGFVLSSQRPRIHVSH